MNITQRIFKSIRDQGLIATLIKPICPVFDRRFDSRYGINTCGISTLDKFTINSGNKDHGARYEPSRVLPLRRMLMEVPKLMPGDKVLLDFGCGKGRVLLLGAQSGFKEVRGVEFAAELCGIARRNWEIYQAKTATSTTCQIIQGDVTEYTIQEKENIFFLFNPFDEVIFSKVLANIAKSLQESPRNVFIVISLPSPQYRQIINQRSEFILAHTFKFWGCQFSVYSNSR